MTERMRSGVRRAIDEVDGAGLYHGYSGRFMYGRECVGVSLEEGLSVNYFFGLLLDGFLDGFGGPDQVAMDGEDTEDLKQLVRMMQECSTDQLGLGTIVYFTWMDDA